MKKLNNKGYLTVEVVLASVIAFGLAYFLLNLTIKVKDATISYGMFIQNVIDFLIIAICIFTFVKIINKLSKKKDEVKEIKKDEKVVLLEEIRDLLKESK